MRLRRPDRTWIPAGRNRAPGPPDFIGVGALGSGTGWWHGQLLKHPQIRAPHHRKRALHFFDTFCARALTDADIAAYHRHFARKPGTVTGEWTGRYMFDAWTPPLLARAAPEAKLIVMLSDPIERYRATFLRRMNRREDEAPIYMTDVAERRRYASQLERLRRFYDADRILVLQFERCRRDPAEEYRRTLRFLGVDEAFAPRRLRRRSAGKPADWYVAPLLRAGLPEGTRGRMLERLTGRPAERELPPLWPDLETALHASFDPEVTALAAMVPELDLSLWPNFERLAPAPA